MTTNEIIRRFPNASASVLRRNRDDHTPRLDTVVSAKPAASLDANPAREKTGTGGVQPRHHISWTIYACHPLDWDNAAASIKEAQDILVTLGWLPGDGWNELTGSARSVRVRTRAEQRTEIKITRIDNE
jgi:hypothetical protein